MGTASCMRTALCWKRSLFLRTLPCPLRTPMLIGRPSYPDVSHWSEIRDSIIHASQTKTAKKHRNCPIASISHAVRSGSCVLWNAHLSIYIVLSRLPKVLLSDSEVQMRQRGPAATATSEGPPEATSKSGRTTGSDSKVRKDWHVTP